jgi:hypothetical protein
MRFDLHKVRTYLVNELNEAVGTVADVRHDGTDIILADLTTGEAVMIYLVDRLMPLNEIRDTLTDNTARNLYTLFVLWGDMLLPEENRRHIPEDWMEALMMLYNGKIYGYDSYGPYASVFPVYFTKANGGLEFDIAYGDAVQAAHLHCEHVHLDSRFLKGFWRVADFGERRHSDAQSGRKDERQSGQRLDSRRNTLEAYFALLEIPIGSDRGVVRRAYYELARRYHPDINTSPDATARMQQINEAYQRIISHLERKG